MRLWQKCDKKGHSNADTWKTVRTSDNSTVVEFVLFRTGCTGKKLVRSRVNRRV